MKMVQMTVQEIKDAICTRGYRETTISGNKKDIETAFIEIFDELKNGIRKHRPEQMFIVDSPDMVAAKPKSIDFDNAESLYKTLAAICNPKPENVRFKNPFMDESFGMFATDGIGYLACKATENAMKESTKKGFKNNNFEHIPFENVSPCPNWEYDFDWFSENKDLVCTFTPGCFSHALVKLAKKVKNLEYQSQQWPWKDIGYSNAIIQDSCFDPEKLDNILTAMFRLGAKKISCWLGKVCPFNSPLELVGQDETGSVVVQGELMQIICACNGSVPTMGGFKLF